MHTRSRVNEIDLLRFIAAVSVVLYHYAFRGHAGDGLSAMPYPALAPVARYGYLGVDLFFMISGFVILMSASAGTLKDFLVSRSVRLYPAFWACCTLTFVVLLLAPQPAMPVSGTQYLANLTMLSGFVGIPSIDGVYWSLFIELQFYALVAAVLATGRIRQAETFLLLWLVVVIVVEAFIPSGKLRFLLIAEYAAYFIAGALAFLILEKGLSRMRIIGFAAAWILAVCQSLGRLQIYKAHFHADWNETGVAAIVTCLFAVMLLVGLGKMGPLGRRSWLMAGALTYPLYLLHQNIGYALFNAAYPALDPHVVFWGTFAAMLIAAFAVNRLVERKLAPPMKRALRRAFDAIPAWSWGRGSRVDAAEAPTAALERQRAHDLSQAPSGIGAPGRI